MFDIFQTIIYNKVTTTYTLEAITFKST